MHCLFSVLLHELFLHITFCDAHFFTTASGLQLLPVDWWFPLFILYVLFGFFSLILLYLCATLPRSYLLQLYFCVLILLVNLRLYTF